MEEEIQKINLKPCCICGALIEDAYGHNAQPLADGLCCGYCNVTAVIPQRIKNLKE